MRRVGVVFGLWGVVGALLYGQGVDVAILQSPGGGNLYANVIARFLETLEKEGIVIQTLTGAMRDGKDSDALQRLLRRNPKLLFVIGMDACLVTQDYYRTLKPEQQVPVVFALAMDPVGHQLVQSEERSGARFAGVELTIPVQRQLRALRDALPHARRVGVIYNPDEFVSRNLIARAQREATRLEIQLQEASVREAADLPGALQFLSDKIDVFWIIPDSIYRESGVLPSVLEFARTRKIPVLTYDERMVRDGALIGVGIDLVEQGALAAEQAIRILRGEKPEDLPLLTPRRALIYYNLDTARALNIQIPEMLLNLADRIYPQPSRGARL